LAHDLNWIFSQTGPLAVRLTAYKPRADQLAMAQAVLQAVENNRTLIAEAGTGTGKTVAYLVPALLAGGKVIISTGTKTLQDQLFNRDIPTVRDALQLPITVSLLKGRANYICHYHLERAKNDGRFTSRDDIVYLARIESYAKSNKSGDRAGLTEVPEDAGIWPLVTSTRENCLGSDCPRYKECFVMEARKQAMAADLVVVNHHLFFADAALRGEGVAELLPACNTVIFDEAHQLPETASLFFGESISTSQIVELARDSRAEAAVGAKDFAELPKVASALEKAARDLRLAVAGDATRLAHAQVSMQEKFVAALTELITRINSYCQVAETQSDRSEGLQRCWERGVELKSLLERWSAADNMDHVLWLEVFAGSLQLNATPLSVGDIFVRRVANKPRALIFTSATLSVRGDFSHYQRQMGLEFADTRAWDSPFNYPSQAMLYVPEGMPDPNSEAYTAATVTAVLPLLEASAGRAFLLFTSLRAMRSASELIDAGLKKMGLSYPILVQGEASKTELLERFRKLGNAVLLGSQSFWEGVDVRGDALSLVMIDRLPFAPPDDPVLAARIQQFTREGRNAFMEFQLPQAVIALKQGAGRLIRDETDRGLLMICDPRLIGKPYGKRIWQSLPPMRRTRVLGEAIAFFRESDAGRAEESSSFATMSSTSAT
jgi:ATP-dependent DNA helicase DinG